MSAPLVVIGAGPVGALLALTLSRRGFDVDVYERRPDLRLEDISAGKSINLALSTRGIHALQRAGMGETLLAEAIPMRGRMMHAVDGTLTFQRYGTDDSQYINSLSRGRINAQLMTRAEQAHAEGGGRVRFHFHQRLIGYDFATRNARLRDEQSGEEHALSAPILFGTDGSGSALRDALRLETQGHAETSLLDAGYKELTLPPAPGDGLGEQGRFALEPHALHIWPRGRFMLIALPNPDGNFTCTLFLPFTSQDDSPSFETLTTPAAAEAFFRAWFPDALERIPNLGEAFAAAPLGTMVTVHAWPWSHGSALLLGDAAHGIVPFFGQGMNAGFEDVAILDALLETRLASGPRDALDWSALFSDFASGRREDTDAIAELAVDNFVEMRDRVGDPRFLLQKAVEVELLRRFPGRAVGRYGLVTFSRIPYRVAREAGALMDGVLARLCAKIDRVDQLDLTEAERLLDAEVVPFLARAGVRL